MIPRPSSTNSSPELLSETYLTSLRSNLPPAHPAPTRPIPALPESPTCPGLITSPASAQKSRRSRLPGATGNGHKRKSSLQGGGVILSAPVVAERRMLGGRGASVRFSTVYGNNVLVGERRVGKENGRESPRIGITTRMSSVLGRMPTVKMSPLPPVPKIPAALGSEEILMKGGGGSGGNGFLAVHATSHGSARESLVSLHSTVNGPLPEYFDPVVREDAAAAAVLALKIDSTSLKLSPHGDLPQETAIALIAEDNDAWEARRPHGPGTGMRRTHSVRSRSASRPGKIRARMPNTGSRRSSRSSTHSNKSNTPRSTPRTMSGASEKPNLSTYTGETGYAVPYPDTIHTSPYIDGTTSNSAGAPFNALPMPPLPAPLVPPPQTPLPSVPVVGNTRKTRKGKPARIMLPQEILAVEARREMRRDEMRMLVEKQETALRPIQEAETSTGGEDENRFRTEPDSEDEHQVKSEKSVVLLSGNASPTIPRAAVSDPLVPAAPLLARKATPHPTRKPVPSTTRGHFYSIFPTSPRRGSRGQLVFPPPALPGTVRRQESGLKSPGMASNPVPISPPRLPAAKQEVAGSPMESVETSRKNTLRKSTIISPTPRIGYTNDGIGSSFAGISSFDFDFLPLGIALTPLRVPVVVTPAGGSVAEISEDRSGLIIERCEGKLVSCGGVAVVGAAEKVSARVVEGEEILTSILNRPRPKKPQSRPVTRGKPTAGMGHRGPQVYGFGAGVSTTFYNELEDELEEASPELQKRGSKYDSEIYTLLPPTSSSPARSTSVASTPASVDVELADGLTLFDVASIARSSLPGSLRDSFYEELRLKYSHAASRLSSDLDSEEEFVGGVLHMGTPSLDSDRESDEGSSFGGSPPLPLPGSPLQPLRVQKMPTMPIEMEETSIGIVKEKNTEALRRAPVGESTELGPRKIAEPEVPHGQPVATVVGTEVQQTLRKPITAPTPTSSASKPLPPTPPQTQSHGQSTTHPLVPRSASRATINPALDNSNSSSSYGPDPNEAFTALQMRTGDPFYSPTSKKAHQPAFQVPTYSPLSSIPPRPAPQAPTQPHQHWQPNMLPGMPKRRVELPMFTRATRHTPAPAPSVPVRETPFFLDVRTPGSKTVYSSSPPLKQEETPTLPTRSKTPATSTQTPLGALPVPTLPENYRQTTGTRPRATTHPGAPPQIPMHTHAYTSQPPVPPIPRDTPNPILTTSGPLPPLPPLNYESVMYVNRNSDPISTINGSEHVLSHYTPGSLITVPNASSPQILHRVDPAKTGGHWRSKSSGEDTGHSSNATAGGTARYTMKVRLEKAFKMGTDRHGVVELGQGELGGNWVKGHEDGVETKKEVRKHASKPSFGGWGTRLKSGVFGGNGQGH